MPAVRHAGENGLLDGVDYVLGYPNAGTPIAAAFKRLVAAEFDIELVQLEQGKVVHEGGRRELGDITTCHEEDETVLAIDDTATGGDTKIEGWRKITEQGLSYAGLVLIVERDPLGVALVRQRTEAGVYPSMHWMTVVQHAAKVLELPSDAVIKELDYPKRLFEWNVANDNAGSLPDPRLLTPNS